MWRICAMQRWWKRLAVVSCGGVACGWLQAWNMVDFGGLFTQIIVMFLQVIVTFLFGGDTSALLDQTTT